MVFVILPVVKRFIVAPESLMALAWPDSSFLQMPISLLLLLLVLGGVLSVALHTRCWRPR
jgi:hypothetical protein